MNSEEGTPMGIGVWYEMRVGNPEDYLFENTDPRGSLRANVRNADGALPEQYAPAKSPRRPPRNEPARARRGFAKIRGLGIPPWLRLHSQGALSGRSNDSPDRAKGGQPAAPGHLGDPSAGGNQVAIIKSGAERAAAAEFAHASAVRPYLVGKAIQEIAKDKEILNTVFEILETEKMLDGDVELTLVPRDSLFARLLATVNGSLPAVPAPQ